MKSLFHIVRYSGCVAPPLLSERKIEFQIVKKAMQAIDSKKENDLLLP
jgi:hypothetical protein